MIRMIAMDFDNTLVGHSTGGPVIDGALLGYLKRYMQEGNYAGIVSGRKAGEMRILFEVMGLLWCGPFPGFYIYRESYVDFVKEGKGISWEQHNVPARKSISELMFRLGRHAGEWRDRMAEEGLAVENWSLYGDFSLEYAMETPEQAGKAIPLLRELLERNGFTDCYVHRNGRLATIIAAFAGKGNVLEKTAGRLGIAADQVLALGDSLNDASMLDGAKGFVPGCPGNSDELVKELVRAAGGYVGRGEASLGVMDVIRQLQGRGRLPQY